MDAYRFKLMVIIENVNTTHSEVKAETTKKYSNAYQNGHSSSFFLSFFFFTLCFSRTSQGRGKPEKLCTSNCTTARIPASQQRNQINPPQLFLYCSIACL